MKKYYSIPTLDFASDTFRQSVVDREKGLYIGHPTTVLLEDGKTVIAVYPKNHGNGQIVLKKSFDGGITWSDRLPVPDSFSTSLEVPTLFRTTDKSGKKHLILFSGLYPIRMSHSEDDGESFSELEPIGDYGGVVAMGDIENTGEGEYIAMFHDDGRFIKGGNAVKMEIWRTSQGTDMRTKAVYRNWDEDINDWGEPVDNWVTTLEKSGDKWEKIHESCRAAFGDDGLFRLYQVKSVDGGLTWSEPEVICCHMGGAKLCEPCIIRSPNGKELCVLLREEARKFNSFMIRSFDNGKSWGEPVELPASLTGDRHTAKYLKDGRLFISFRDTTHETPTKGDWVAWVGTYDDIVNLREGQYRLRIMKDYHNWDCAYPGVEILPDGTIVTTSYGHFTPNEEAYVVCVRIHPDEIDAAADDSHRIIDNSRVENIKTSN